MVENAKVWKTVHGIYAVLTEGHERPMLEGIAANFGKWETANSVDTSEYALDCHGHLHLLLSRLAIDRLSNDEGCRGLVGRVNHPDTHLEEDCRELENHRLLSLENKIIRGSLQRLDTKVSDIASRMDKSENQLKDISSKLETLLQLVLSKGSQQN